MEFTTTKTVESRTNFNQYDSLEQDKFALERLNGLLEINRETERRKLSFRSDREELEASMMSRPLDLRQTFSYFGLMLGLLTPAALFIKVLLLNGRPGHEDGAFFAFCILINILTSIAGYFSGRLIANMVRQAETFPWWAMIFLSPFIGIIWGVIAGGIGGAIVYLVGGVFGAIIGGMVGGAAMPLFLIVHRALKKGEQIETKHFLPLAFGIVLTICSFILGFPQPV